jgi:pectate lyase
MTGFAAYAGTTGGLGRHVIYVTNTKDSGYRQPTIAGSLRDATVQAERLGGAWISFASSLGSSPVIHLERSLRPPSNVTIDGGCSGVTITTPVDGVVVLRAVSNVVLTRLVIHGGVSGEAVGDCVGVGESDRIWIAFNRISACGDGLIDVTKAIASGRATRITVAYNILADHDKTMLVGTLDCQHQIVPAPCPAFADRPFLWSAGVQLTLHDNLFLRTGQRNPKLSGLAYGHMYRNVLLLQPMARSNGRVGALYGAYASNGARLMADDNLIIKDDKRGGPPTWSDLGSDGRLQSGAARVSRLKTLSDWTSKTGHSGDVPDPPYGVERYAHLPFAAIDATREVASHAGPNGFW